MCFMNYTRILGYLGEMLLFFLVLELVADLPMIFPLRVFPCDVFAAWWAACCTGALALQRIPEAIVSAR